MRNSSIWIQYFRYKEYLTKLHSVTMALNSRSSRSQIFFKLGVLKNLEIFTGKYLCWNLSLFNEIAGLKAYNFIKKRLQHRCFPVNIAKFVRAYFKEHLWWLLLNFILACKLNVGNNQEDWKFLKNKTKGDRN